MEPSWVRPNPPDQHRMFGDVLEAQVTQRLAPVRSNDASAGAAAFKPASGPPVALAAPEEHSKQKPEPGGYRDRYERTLANSPFELLVGIAKSLAAGVAEIGPFGFKTKDEALAWIEAKRARNSN